MQSTSRRVFGVFIAPYLFISGVEILSIALQNNRKMKGFYIDGYEYLLGQNADDAFLLMGGSETSMRECINVFNYQNAKRYGSEVKHIAKTKYVRMLL